MREIKIQVLFEVYNKDFSKSIKRHYTTVDRLMSGDDAFDYINGPEVVAKRQFTGLKDKNGVEIYESDIINVEYNYIENVKVSFLCGAYNIAGYKLSRCKVVGNIYESPELLKK